MHGFLVLKSEDQKVIAIGDQIAVTRGDQVRSRLIFRFRDGSIDDEVTTFRQGNRFELLTDHHVQRGPSFPKPLDVQLNVPRGEVTYHEAHDGKDEVKTEHMDLPNDLANGLVVSVVENMALNKELKVSYVVASAKPRVVQLSIKPDGQDSFRVAGAKRAARRMKIHVELGGVTGLVAPLLGKQPSDFEMWVMDGPVPAFVKLQGALYEQGPIWTIELISPVWR